MAEEKKADGNSSYSAGDYDAAVTLYTEAIALCPQDASAPFYGNRSAAYLMLKQYGKAMDDSQKAIQLDPTFAKGYNRIAKVHIALGQYEAAKQALVEQSEKTKIKATQKELQEIADLQAQFKQLQSSLDAKSYSSVLYQATAILEKSPASLPVKIAQCDAMIGLRQYEKAKALSTDLYKVDARNSEVLRVRGLSMYYTGNIEMATKHFSEVLRFDPDNSKCSALFKMVRSLEKKKSEGNTLFQDGKNADAIQCYTDALAIDPHNTDYNAILYSNRSAAYVKLRQWSHALSDCNKCLDAKPTFTKAKIRRAQVYLELKQFDEAIRDYNELMKEDPQNQEYSAALRKAKLELKKSKRKDYYVILGITQSATASDIKKAYRKKALEWHPDKHNGSDEAKKVAEAKFKDITESYECLSDDQKKRRYDSGVDLEDDHDGHGHGGHGHGGDMNDIFRMFFAQQQGGGGRRGHHGFGF